jgi:hypothetical protein
MKNFLKLVALALFAVALTGVALAQDSTQVGRANIPFNFYAGRHLMSAGEYTIVVNQEVHIVTIGQKATGNRAFLLGSPDDSSRDYRTVLTFRLVAGDVYALSELQSPDLGVSFNAKGPQSAMKAQTQRTRSVEVIAEAK